ncbi:MAG TPA: PAS domain-containing protein, partial [Zoogloea sp.]|nr:PAS domain-containing protein [Zoogloea sp.]
MSENCPVDPASHTTRPRRAAGPRTARATDPRFDEILASANDAIISIDEAQTITLFNRGAERIFGYSAADMIGQPLDRL